MSLTGTGNAIGHHGEILQGVFEDEQGLRRGLVSLPCPSLKSSATFVVQPSGALLVDPAWKTKARTGVRLFARYRGLRDIGGQLSIRSNIPVGFGMGSSTSDVVAAIRAVADAFDIEPSAQEIARVAVAAELACDSTMFSDQAVLFAQREGEVIDYLGRPLPPLHVIGVNTAPDAPVDTLETPSARYDSAEIEAFRPLRGLLRRAVRTQDCALLGRVATASAVINQRRLPQKGFDEIRAVGERNGAVGLQVAHSGTVLGLLFDAQADAPSHGIEDSLGQLESIGFTATLYRHAGSV